MDWWSSRNIIWVYMINVQYIHYNHYIQTIQSKGVWRFLTAEKSRLQRLNPRPSWGTPGWAWGRGYPLCHCCGKCQVHRLHRGSKTIGILMVYITTVLSGGGLKCKLHVSRCFWAYIFLKVFWKPSAQKRWSFKGGPKKIKMHLTLHYGPPWKVALKILKEVVILYPCLANLGDGLLLLY